MIEGGVSYYRIIAVLETSLKIACKNKVLENGGRESKNILRHWVRWHIVKFVNFKNDYSEGVNFISKGSSAIEFKCQIANRAIGYQYTTR